MFREHFNLDADGLLGPKHLAVGLKNLDIPIAADDVGRLMQVLDVDADEKLSQSEFMSAIGAGVAVKKPVAAAAKPNPFPKPAQHTPVKHVPPASPGHAPADSPAQGKLAEPTRHRHPRALLISDSNNELASMLFDLLDANGDGRLDATDLSVFDGFDMTDMERKFHGMHAMRCALCDRLPRHFRCCIAAQRLCVPDLTRCVHAQLRFGQCHPKTAWTSLSFVIDVRATSQTRHDTRLVLKAWAPPSFPRLLGHRLFTYRCARSST